MAGNRKLDVHLRTKGRRQPAWQAGRRAKTGSLAARRRKTRRYLEALAGAARLFFGLHQPVQYTMLKGSFHTQIPRYREVWMAGARFHSEMEVRLPWEMSPG